jgi:hypothetical protein
MRSVVLAVALSLISTAAVAQSAGFGHGFAAAGIVSTSDDAASRTRFPDGPVSGGLWFIGAAAFVGHGVALGVEALSLGSVTGSYNADCCILRDQEEEKAILATVRWRALRLHRLAFDPLVAFGALTQHRETENNVRFPPITNLAITNESDTAGGFGVDVAVTVLPHVVVAPMFRVYTLRRSSPNIPNVVASSSTRFVIGVTAGGSW